MNITIIAVGKIKEKFYTEAIKEYSKRLSRYCSLKIIEVEDEKTPDKASEALNAAIMKKEAEGIRKHIPKDSYIISLAVEGKKYDSVGFASHIQRLGINGHSDLVFIIGGSLGIDEALKKDSAELISFSDMTFPHQLMRVILLEQVYRCFRIINNEPYHK